MDAIEFHPEARAEYQDAIAWYAERSPAAADRFEEAVDRVLGRIRHSPDSFPTIDDCNRYVMVKRFPYSVIYRAIPKVILVVAVAHSKRQSGYWNNRSTEPNA